MLHFIAAACWRCYVSDSNALLAAPTSDSLQEGDKNWGNYLLTQLSAQDDGAAPLSCAAFVPLMLS